MIAKLLMNSLYGKFGMKDEIIKLEILDNVTDDDKSFISSKLDYYGPDIVDMIELDNYIIISSKQSTNLYYNEKDDIWSGTEVNIAIASAITAYARIHMSYFKNNPDFKLYYSDTDSAVINKALPENMVGNKLGQLKLEYIINKAVFLAPKVYAYITDDGKEIIKVKGLNKETIKSLSFTDLETLLIQDSSREFNQEKWFKSILAGEITTSDIIYTLKVTSNKRDIIYDDNGVFNETQPLFYDNIHYQFKNK